MVKLTPSLIESIPQELNCIGRRQLDLRGYAIPAIEHLGVAGGGFDSLDISQNALTQLGDGFPHLPNLTCVYASGNRISTIDEGISDKVPNLHTLVLTNNALDENGLNLDELSKLGSLEVLCLRGNPLFDNQSQEKQTDTRLRIIAHLPALRFLNFTRIRKQERETAHAKYGSHAEHVHTSMTASTKRRKPRDIATATQTPKSLTFSVGRSEELGQSTQDERQKQQGRNSSALSPAQIESLRNAIWKAESLEEVAAIQAVLDSGSPEKLAKLMQDFASSSDAMKDD